MDNLLLDTCQELTASNKFANFKECSDSLNVAVVFASRALVRVTESNKKAFFYDDEGDKGMSRLQLLPLAPKMPGHRRTLTPLSKTS